MMSSRSRDLDILANEILKRHRNWTQKQDALLTQIFCIDFHFIS